MNHVLDYPFIASPNQSSRQGAQACVTVFHYTAGGSSGGAVSWLCNPAAKASAHFVISRSGDTTQLVSLDRKAWHAGVSEVLIENEMRADANRHTIGVELANHGFLQRINGDYYYELGHSLKRYRRSTPSFARLAYDNGLEVEGWWEPFQDLQIDALQKLLLKLKTAGYEKASQNLIGHEEIGMPFGRKKDPGPLFPWGRFYRKLDRRTEGHPLDTA